LALMNDSFFSPTENDFAQDRQEGLRPSVVACVINKKGQVLLGFKNKFGIWEMPQGRIEEGENLISALEREIAEELGKSFLESVFVPASPLLAVEQVIFPGSGIEDKKLSVGGKKIQMKGKKYYFCAVGQIQEREPEEIEYNEFGWFSAKKAFETIEQIPQKGKKRILKKAVEILEKNGFIK